MRNGGATRSRGDARLERQDGTVRCRVHGADGKMARPVDIGPKQAAVLDFFNETAVLKGDGQSTMGCF